MFQSYPRAVFHVPYSWIGYCNYLTCISCSDPYLSCLLLNLVCHDWARKVQISFQVSIWPFTHQGFGSPPSQGCLGFLLLRIIMFLDRPLHVTWSQPLYSTRLLVRYKRTTRFCRWHRAMYDLGHNWVNILTLLSVRLPMTRTLMPARWCSR